MNIALWFVQILLSSIFLVAGSTKVFSYEKAKSSLLWVNDVPKSLVTFIGIVEILGAIGLVLPYALDIAPILTPLAALGIAVIMILAAGFHAKRKEIPNVAINAVLLAMAIFIIWGRI